VNVKTDYRYSFNSKFTVNATLNSNLEKWRRSTNGAPTPATPTPCPNATTSGVIPGFTDRITQVRPVPGLDARLAHLRSEQLPGRTYLIAAGGEHTWGPLQLEYSADFAENDLWRGTPGVGYLTSRVTNIGWILDRTESDLYPKFIQTAGSRHHQPRQLPADRQRPHQDAPRSSNVQQLRHARADARYVLPTTPVHLRDRP
jgi:hypothetical protein